MGSAPPHGDALRRHGFHILVLCALEYQPEAAAFPGVDVARIHLDDAELHGPDFERALHLSTRLSRALRVGKKILVTCAQGRNRSGLVTALTLADASGCGGRVATHVVKQRRRAPFGQALSNDHYVAALKRVPPFPAGTLREFRR